MMQSKPLPSTMLRPFSVIKVVLEACLGSALLCQCFGQLCLPKWSILMHTAQRRSNATGVGC